MSQTVERLKALAEPTRLRMVRLLLEKQELCSCELADSLVEPQVDISRHAKILKAAGLLTERKEGRWVYYRLPAEAKRLAQAIKPFLADKDLMRVFAGDDQRLATRLKLREDGKCLIGVRNPQLGRITRGT